LLHKYVDFAVLQLNFTFRYIGNFEF